jgi:hypothetical protein
MRKAYEPLLYAAGVNLVTSGHVHAVERSYPVYNNVRLALRRVIHYAVPTT